MSATNWANSARRVEYQQRPEDQQAIDILETVMMDKCTPPDAANYIATIYEPLVKSGNHIAVSIFWSILSNAIRVCGDGEEQAKRLTDLIIAIQSLPDMIYASGSIVKDSQNKVYWKDLPGWILTFREYAIDIDQPDDFEDDVSWKDQAASLHNATNFAATLLDLAPFRTGMEFHACTALSAALNTQSQDREHQKSYGRAELYLPAAATWILVAGSKLRAACYNRHDAGHVLRFEPERWNEWHQSFLAVARDAKFSENGRAWASRAAAHMQAM